MNTDVLKICKNYKCITECEFLDDDMFSIKLVDYYKYFVSRIDLNDLDSIKKAQCLDIAVFKYVQDLKFARKLRDTIDVSAVTSDNFAYLNEFIEYIVIFSDRYDNTKDTIVIQTQWI